MKHVFGKTGALHFSERILLKVSLTVNPYPLGIPAQQVGNLIDTVLSETFAMAAAPSQELFTWLSGAKPLYLQRQKDTGDFVGALITDWDPGVSELIWLSTTDADASSARLTYKDNPVVICIVNETRVDYAQPAFDDVPWSRLKPMPWRWASLFLNGLVVAAHACILRNVSVETIARVHVMGGDVSQWFSEWMLEDLSGPFTVEMGRDSISHYQRAMSVLQRLTQQHTGTIHEKSD